MARGGRWEAAGSGGRDGGSGVSEGWPGGQTERGQAGLVSEATAGHRPAFARSLTQAPHWRGQSSSPRADS